MPHNQQHITPEQKRTVDCLLAVCLACRVEARFTGPAYEKGGSVCVNITYGDGVGHGGGGLWVDADGFYVGMGWTREEQVGGWQFVTLLHALRKDRHDEYMDAKAQAETSRAARKARAARKGVAS